MLRLYRAPFSTNVERVLLALEHKGLSHEPVWISYEDRSQVERVSGQGLVPVVEEGTTVVNDSRRILAWLEERCPDPPLYPRERARRAEMEAFVDWFDEVWKRWPNGIEAELGRPAPDHALIAHHARRMAEALDRFEALLDGRPYLFGDALSAADCIAHPFLKYAAGRDPADDEHFHRILEERQRLQTGRHDALAAWIERVRPLAPPNVPDDRP